MGHFDIVLLSTEDSSTADGMRLFNEVVNAGKVRMVRVRFCKEKLTPGGTGLSLALGDCSACLGAARGAAHEEDCG